jgi:FtsP/CotA-like multicopper oxidase with cupredoxin domain
MRTQRHESSNRFLAGLFLAAAVLSCPTGRAGAQASDGDGKLRLNYGSAPATVRHRMTEAERRAAAERKGIRVSTQPFRTSAARAPVQLNPLDMLNTCPPAVPGGMPDYWDCPNWANSPLPEVTGGIPSGGIRKFVDGLPGVGPQNANNLGQYIPIASKGVYNGDDYYQIGVVEYSQKLHSDLPPTRLRGYKDLSGGDGKAHYLGPLIIAQRDKPVRIKFVNQLPTGIAGDLFIPTDLSVMGAGMGGKFPDGSTCDPETQSCAMYTQNRADIHLHGNDAPWISDGTPHQWVTPAGENTVYKKGDSFQNVPDMVGPGNAVPSPNAGDGIGTYYYPNEMSGRLMFYHDHSYGITRLNVYAGEAAGYLLTDPVEEGLINSGVLPDLGGVYRYGVPLIIQDKTFVPGPEQLKNQDPTWDTGKYGGVGSLWFPHVYMTNQNPGDTSGANNFGRWDYGPWFWPVMTVGAGGLKHGEQTYNGITIPGTPLPSLTPEAFMDTMLVNGTPYPKLEVQRRPYRFRILNASNDRFLNLQLYYADPENPTEVKMVPAEVTPGFPPGWPTDMRVGGVPDPKLAGPDIIMIGTEGGFLEAPAVLPAQPIGYNYNRRDITVLNLQEHQLLLGPAERADIIVDFSNVPAGAKLILYNDAPAPVPAFDPRTDYYTGSPDNTWQGGAPPTLPGYGPNTRTIMQFTTYGPALQPFNLSTLRSAWPAAVAAAQPRLPVPEGVYSAIASTSIFYSTGTGVAPIQMPLQPKAIHELFETDYGRMNAILAAELPLTNWINQTTLPLDYVDPPNDFAVHGSTQLWKITHNGVDTHAMHFHLFNVQLINRVGWDGAVRMPEPYEVGWKETVRMNPLEDAIVAFVPKNPSAPWPLPQSVRLLNPAAPVGSSMGFSQLDPYTGGAYVPPITNQLYNFGYEYVWHCHLLGHEENDMMRPLVLVTAPTAPTLVTAVTASSAAVVSFLPGLTGGAAVSIYYTVTAIPPVVGIASGTVSPITIAGLTNGATYSFTVTATNPAGSATSLPSNIITAAAVPDAPTSVTAVAGNGQATITWLAPNANGGPILSYIITATEGGNTVTMTAAGSPAVFTGLQIGTPYTFTVAAVNIAGTGPASAPSNSVTPQDTPVVPGSLQASFVAPTYAILRWGAPAVPVLTFDIMRSADGGVTWTAVGSTTGNSTFFRATGLASRTTYLFRLSATNNQGTSGFSNTISVTTR